MQYIFLIFFSSQHYHRTKACGLITNYAAQHAFNFRICYSQSCQVDVWRGGYGGVSLLRWGAGDFYYQPKMAEYGRLLGTPLV